MKLVEWDDNGTAGSTELVTFMAEVDSTVLSVYIKSRTV